MVFESSSKSKLQMHILGACTLCLKPSFLVPLLFPVGFALVKEIAGFGGRITAKIILWRALSQGVRPEENTSHAFPIHQKSSQHALLVSLVKTGAQSN